MRLASDVVMEICHGWPHGFRRVMTSGCRSVEMLVFGPQGAKATLSVISLEVRSVWETCEHSAIEFSMC